MPVLPITSCAAAGTAAVTMKATVNTAMTCVILELMAPTSSLNRSRNQAVIDKIVIRRSRCCGELARHGSSFGVDPVDQKERALGATEQRENGTTLLP